MSMPLHPRFKLWMDLAEVLAEASAVSAAKLKKAVKPVRSQACRTRRPGNATPLWNACSALLREQLKPYGSKARLARYLGIPRQRLNDFLKAGSRLPDAEILLLMLHWSATLRTGRDLST